MGFAVERQHVVLAKAVELDVFDNDHLLVVFDKLGAVEHRDGVHVVAAGEGEHRFGHTFGGFEQSFTLGIFTQQMEHLLIVEHELFQAFLFCHKRWK